MHSMDCAGKDIHDGMLCHSSDCGCLQAVTCLSFRALTAFFLSLLMQQYDSTEWSLRSMKCLNIIRWVGMISTILVAKGTPRNALYNAMYYPNFSLPADVPPSVYGDPNSRACS